MFFTLTNPMEDDNDMGETPRDLSKPRIAPYKKYLEISSKYDFLVQFKSSLRREDCNFTKHGHMESFSTTYFPPFALRKRCVRNTKEELYQKVRLTSRLPRGVLKANSHSGQQDQRDQDARSSWDPPSESKSYRETSNNAVDHIILGNTTF